MDAWTSPLAPVNKLQIPGVIASDTSTTWDAINPCAADFWAVRLEECYIQAAHLVQQPDALKQWITSKMEQATPHVVFASNDNQYMVAI
jgi:hypothetical protein